uniref:CDKN2A interacting protein n=1 Tax=Chinchilla lanigera TaxID=34839 RepID=A0A8C2YRC2_CHILA
MAREVSEYLSQNPRVAAWVEALRCEGETDKHWRHRREFLLRNAGDLAPAGDEAADAKSGAHSRQLQQLISFSMAWANHVFLGCRYSQKVMDKILSMAEGIKVTDAPIHTTRDELVAKVKKRGISSSNEGKSNSAVERDLAKISAKTERTSAQQENSSTSSGSSSKSESSGNSTRSSGGSIHNNSTSEGDRSVSGQSSSSSSSSNISSQVTAGSGKASESEAPDKHGSAAFVSSLLKSSVNSHITPPTDCRQQSGSPKKSALESSSVSASQSSSEIEVPLLGTSGSSEVELPLLSSKPSSETASSGLTSKSSSEAGVPSSVSKNTSSSGTSLLTSKSSSTNTSLLTSKSTSQVAASLLASKSSSQATSVSQLASKISSQSSTSQLPSKSTSQSSESSVKFSCCKLTNEDVKQKQPFFNRLYKTVAWKLVAVGGFSPSVNHGELLNAAVEALKATLDVFFVPLKELADLPQNKSSQESIVCELRCKSVYLGTGCGKSKENAKAVASREALKLFLKKKVVVKICKRKYRGSEIEDLVLLDEESRPVNLPPALKHPQELL